MNLGDKLIEIRKENKMSQEKLAEVLNVSRQTISNWENYKNYPDIATIIKISDKFDISLDILLKGDKNMVNKIDKKLKNSTKYRNTLIIIIIVVVVVVSIFGVYSFKYNLTKNRLENKFNSALKENNFTKNKEGYYSMTYKNQITYGVPNPKMPSLFDFHLDFHAKQLYCDIKYEDGSHLDATWIDYNDYDITIIKGNVVIGSSESLKEAERTNITKLSVELNLEEKELKEIIEKGNSLYKAFYE